MKSDFAQDGVLKFIIACIIPGRAVLLGVGPSNQKRRTEWTMISVQRWMWVGAAMVLGITWASAQEVPVEGIPEPKVEFSVWLEALRNEALQKGITAETFDTALANAKPIPRIIELDRSQPEFSLTFREYLTRTVPQRRVETGRRLLRENKAILDKVSKEFKVQPRFLVAFWGIESDFGRITGGFSVPKALATLAYDGRRSQFFRDELLNALQILDQKHITPQRMKGSWAGAMGQTQFMPSSFLKFAVDFNNDGRRDIWTTPDDVFASAANYLTSSGWQGDQTWGRAVRLPADFDGSLISLDVVKELSEWQTLGVRRSDGTNLPERPLKASLVRPGDDNSDVFVVYENYRTTLKWNRSTYFALAVGHLADRIGQQ